MKFISPIFWSSRERSTIHSFPESERGNYPLPGQRGGTIHSSSGPERGTIYSSPETEREHHPLLPWVRQGEPSFYCVNTVDLMVIVFCLNLWLGYTTFRILANHNGPHARG